MKTISELTQKIWTIKDQTIRCKDFKKSCLKAIRGSQIIKDDQIKDLEGSLAGIIPDAYKICNFCKVIKAFEIEDSHPLDLDKIKKYAVLWFDIDSLEEWNLILCVTDRYGLNPTYPDLKSTYYALMMDGELKNIDKYEMEASDFDTKGDR